MTEEFRGDEARMNYWLDRCKELNLDPTCELFLRGDPEMKGFSTPMKYWGPIGGGLVALIGTTMTRIMVKRPMLSSYPRIIAATLLGMGLGWKAQEFKKTATNENDLYLFYYMTLHPEDFPPKEKILYNDYLASWVPVR